MAADVTSLKSLAEFLGETNIKIVVPKIQRAYAQGRKSEKNIRNQFVDELFTALEKGATLELSFVYGSKIKSEDGNSIRFELLDGQQRITTLVLLNWFLACAGGKDIPQFIKSFNYETRTTSETFLRELADNPLDVISEKPSDALRNRQWYTQAFDKDDSVRGMLRMLDAIYYRYQDSPSRNALYDNLVNLKFYELDLDDFGLTEEIYVKMNARGLQLTPFENFKADLTKLLKDESIPEYNNEVEMDIAGHPMVPYYLSISQKIDNRWLDIFWSKEDADGRDYCDRFFRFFYRFFATKYFLEIQKEIRPDDFRPNAMPDRIEGKIWDFLWNLSDTQDKTYLGFKYYDQFFRGNPAYMDEIAKILDTFSNQDCLNIIKEEAVFPWEKKGEKYQSNFFEAKYELGDAIYFAAVCEFIKRSEGKLNTVNFRRWMRIVRNIVENQLLRNVDQYVRTVRRLTQILDLPDAMINVYQALSNDTLGEREMRALKEEQTKARIIVNNPTEDWETAFTKAELHPLFRGSIAFIMDDMPNNVAAFNHRFEIIGRLFDENGMTELAKENHRLIRSMIRQLNSRQLLKDAAITEREDTTHHLKVLMLEREPIRKFLSALSDVSTIEEVVARLDSIADNEEIMVVEQDQSLIEIEPDVRFFRAFKRLCLDNRIYDYVHDVELRENKKYLQISYDNDGIAVARPRSWYDWLYIDTDRACLIDAFLGKGFYFENELKDPFYDRDGFYKKYGDHWGFRIWLYKNIDGQHRFALEFLPNGKARFVFDGKDELLSTLFHAAYQHERWENWRVICDLDGIGINDLQALENKTKEIEALIIQNISSATDA